MATLFTTPLIAAATAVVAAKISAFHLSNSSTIQRFCPLFSPPKSKTLLVKSFHVPVRANSAQKYIYPDPDPEFAVAETQKFKMEIMRKLSMEKGTFGDQLHFVVDVCAEDFATCDSLFLQRNLERKQARKIKGLKVPDLIK